jgi:phosphotransferase system enzyme I (PtsI)
MDRGNERIAHLYEPLEPAILRAVDLTVRAGHAAGIWTGVCGAMAGDPRMAVLLLGLEVAELSVSPFDVPRVKAAVRAVEFARVREIARACLAQRCAHDIRALLRRELDPLLPPHLLGEGAPAEEPGESEAESGAEGAEAEDAR